MGWVGLILFWGCFAASGTGNLEITQSTMKFQNHQGILERNTLLTVRELSLRCRSRVEEENKLKPLKNGWELNLDNSHPLCESKSQEYWTSVKRWENYSVEMPPLEGQAVCSEIVAKLTCCQVLIEKYRNYLLAVIVPERCSHNILNNFIFI